MGQLFSSRKDNRTGQAYGVFSWSIADNIIYGDRIFAAMYGLLPTQVDEGIPIELLFGKIAPQDVERIARRTHHCILTGEPFEEEFSIHRSLTDIIVARVYSACFHRVDGVLTHCAGSIFQIDPPRICTGHNGKNETPSIRPGFIRSVKSDNQNRRATGQ